MAYNNLKDIFLANEQTLYAKNPLVGREKVGWYLELRPNSSNLNSAGDPFLDTRSVPLVSSARDTVRITRFLLSGKGILFLGKQTLLQTGNTFGQTRLLNPLFVAKQLVPFVHFPRHASNVPLFGALFGKPPGDAPPGGQFFNRLQKETLKSTQARVIRGRKKEAPPRLSLFSNILNQIVSPFKAVISSIGGATVGKDERPELNYSGGNPFWESIKEVELIKVRSKSSDNRELIRAAAKATIDKLKNTKSFEFTGLTTRPEFTPLQVLFIPGTGFIAGSGKSFVDRIESQLKATNGTFQKLLNAQLGYEKTSGISIHTARQSLNSVSPRGTAKRVSRIKLGDDINQSVFQDNGLKKDYVIFTLQSGGHTVQLRAYIDEFNVNVMGDYTEKRYIGRYEKFIVYQGVNRKLDLSFFMLPQDVLELRILWEKLDWITRLTYPATIQSSGHFEPPLTKLTIGRVFDKAAVFVNSVTWKTDTDTIWDIDKEVPQYVRVAMQFTLIEAALNTLKDGALYGIVKDNRRLLAAINKSIESYVIPKTAVITQQSVLTGTPGSAPQGLITQGFDPLTRPVLPAPGGTVFPLP